jgi:hypothetical protein
MVLIVVIGVYPRPFFDRIQPSVAPIAGRFESLDSAQPVTASAVPAINGSGLAAKKGRTLSTALPLTQQGVPAYCEPGSRFSLGQPRRDAAASASPAPDAAGTVVEIGSGREHD